MGPGFRRDDGMLFGGNRAMTSPLRAGILAAIVTLILDQAGDTFGAPRPTILMAVRTPAIREELKFSADQQEKISEVDGKWRQEFKGARPSLQEYYKKYAAVYNDTHQAIGKILDTKQNDRLQQILLQHALKSGLDELLDTPIAMKELKLTKAQQELLTAPGLYTQNPGYQ